jgi:hypothetical protein
MDAGETSSKEWLSTIVRVFAQPVLYCVKSLGRRLRMIDLHPLESDGSEMQSFVAIALRVLIRRAFSVVIDRIH